MARADDIEKGGKGKGKGKARGFKALPREVEVSKKLSWLLRHGAAGEGLVLGKGGYVNLQEVVSKFSNQLSFQKVALLDSPLTLLEMNNRKIRPLKVTLDEIKDIVKDNEKQRFSLIYVGSTSTARTEQETADLDGDAAAEERTLPSVPATEQQDQDASHYVIRANQGHSLKVDDSELLTPITVESGNLPSVVVHGTTRKAWPLIVESGGLKRQTRNHVHFATGLPATLKESVKSQAINQDNDQGVQALPDKETNVVLSGMRATSSVFIFLDLPKALHSGLKFGLSDNGVVLTEGDSEGIVSLSLFQRVEEKGGKVLVEDGTVIAQLA